jgi:hypothetical protein
MVGDTYSVGSLRQNITQSLDNPFHITTGTGTPENTLSARDVSGKCAVKIVVKNAKSGTRILFFL